MTYLRETLALILVWLIVFAILAPEQVGAWAGKAAASYYMTSMDILWGKKQ